MVIVLMPRYYQHDRRARLNPTLVLAVVAGAAIAVQVVANSIGLRVLGVGGLIGISGLTTGLVGFTVALFLSRPEFTGRAVSCAIASGLLGAFIVGSITIAAGQGGLAQTLSLVIASQLILGVVIDRLGVFGPASQDIGVLKILGIALILIGGVLVVRS